MACMGGGPRHPGCTATRGLTWLDRHSSCSPPSVPRCRWYIISLEQDGGNETMIAEFVRHLVVSMTGLVSFKCRKRSPTCLLQVYQAPNIAVNSHRLSHT